MTNSTNKNQNTAATYGGPGWRPREASLDKEIRDARHWRPCGCNTEWMPLKEVILHQPGPELCFDGPPDAQLMLERPDLEILCRQTEALAAIYRRESITVHFTKLSESPLPNFLFQRDLFWTTPHGVVLARPGSTVRAGEEVLMGSVLSRLRVPIIAHPIGRATFEGADALWIDHKTVLVGCGRRTNKLAIHQLGALLASMDVELLAVDLAPGVQHLLGVVNFIDAQLAAVNGGKSTPRLGEILEQKGIKQIVLQPSQEVSQGLAMNFVTLAPRRILMPAHCPKTRAIFKSEGIEVLEAEISEYLKAAGGIACLTGILRRED